MSWMARLYETYEAAKKLDLPDDQRLMPVSHTMQNAHIRIVLDGDGNFKRAEVLEKTQIVLPATEKSAGRTRKPIPHPLADKIQYVARDYPEFGGKKAAEFDEYVRQLDDWANSDFSNAKIRAVRDYVKKGRIVADLVEQGILHVDENNQLIDAWPKERGEAPVLFKILPKKNRKTEQGDALVCWSVEIVGDQEPDTWKDDQIQSAWIAYDMLNAGNKSLCYVTGEDKPVAENHPAKLRHSGDKAKLISSNDWEGFTFRGRFTDPKETKKRDGLLQAVSVSFDVTQKAHNALRWLIGRQGFRNGDNGDQVIVTWSISGGDVPDPMEELSFLSDIGENPGTVDGGEGDGGINLQDLGQLFAARLNKRMAGYTAELPPSDHIIVMGLDSASQGRMAITYYQELAPTDFIDRITRWHQDFSWFQRYTLEKGTAKNKVKKTVWLPGSPSPKAITEAVYGDTISDSLKKNTIERLLPCIIEARPLPRDLVEKAVRRAVNRHAYKSGEEWKWERILGIACALFRGYSKRTFNQPKEYDMALEENNDTRDYLFGRLLAIAERIEQVALWVADEKRSTTAARLMQRFADRPASTWRTIELSLQPYIQRLKHNRAAFCDKQLQLLDEVMGKFQSCDFTSDKPLTGEFLLAFHSQRLVLNQKSGSSSDNPSEDQ